MYYEIHVSLNDRHLFYTSTIMSIEQLRVLFNIFKQKFPKAEGYKLTVNRSSW